ncbi:MAG: hypothetical protein ACI30R_06605, partial [Sodaliphilus sp.]
AWRKPTGWHEPRRGSVVASSLTWRSTHHQPSETAYCVPHCHRRWRIVVNSMQAEAQPERSLEKANRMA